MITFTDRAQEMLKTFLGDGDDTQALRISVGGTATAPSFDLEDPETDIEGRELWHTSNWWNYPRTSWYRKKKKKSSSSGKLYTHVCA